MKVLDDYLDFVAARRRPNTLLATAYALGAFFSIVGLAPDEVTSRDVLAFMTAQRAGRASIARTGKVTLVALSSGDSEGVSNRTLRRRLSSISGLYAYLVARGDIAENPVPRGLPTRRERNRSQQGVPLIRSTGTMPRILTPAEVDQLTASLRTHRDRAMIAAMVLGGPRLRGHRPTPGRPPPGRTPSVRR